MNNDLISRKTAIKMFLDEGMPTAAVYIERMPPAQPERLTDDDFETIRIHLNAYKETLCNQHRWKEAKEYQNIIDRFMAFAYEQPKTRCKDCAYGEKLPDDVRCELHDYLPFDYEDFCSMGVKRVTGN